MKYLLALLLPAVGFANVALNLDVENLHGDDVGNLCPSNSTVVLLVSTANSSFGDLTQANAAFTVEADDQVLGMFEVTTDGVFQNAAVFNLNAQVSVNDPLLLVWYPGLPFDANRPGPGPGQKFGTYRSATATAGSDIGWLVPADGSGLNLFAFSADAGGDVPDASLVANQITAGNANQPPTAVCRDVTKSAGTNCSATVTGAEVNNGSTDPDGDALTFNLSPAGPFGIGTHNVTLTASDPFGASNSCRATITIVDATAPAIACPSNISTQIPAGQVSVVVNYPAPIASDACSSLNVTTTPASGTSFPVGSNTVVATAVDGAGNSNSCSFLVIVIAQPATNTAPVALCQNVTRTGCSVAVTAAEVDDGSSDADADPITLALQPAGPFTVGTNAVTLIVADNRGGTNTCNASIIVVDNTPPVITCPSNISTQVLPGVTGAIVNFATPVATDNCAVASVVCVPASGATFPLGTTPVICTATDGAGNTNSCAFNVTVTTANTNVHDLAVIALRAPKKVKLSNATPTVTGVVRVTIQNLSPHAETITNLTGLVDLQVIALTNCPNLVATLVATDLPVTLKPNQKLNVYFQVTYSIGCVPDLRKSTKLQPASDYRYVATVHDEADTNPGNDSLPGTTPTDVYVWFF